MPALFSMIPAVGEGGDRMPTWGPLRMPKARHHLMNFERGLSLVESQLVKPIAASKCATHLQASDFFRLPIEMESL